MFSGAYTALVTPFHADGSIDFGKLRELVAQQAEGGIDGVVPVGTTGESPTMSMDEHCRVVETVVQAAQGRLTVIAGTGANSTSEALELTRRAKEAGADGSLQITPYYNKPNQTGLIRHFSAVADIGLPVLLYNVPGRTGREIAIETIVTLSAHPHIVAVKEAGGSVDRVSAILAACKMDVLSGDDNLTLPMMSVGACGVISVASNVAPQWVADLVHLALRGQWDEARALHYKAYELFRGMFIDTNPIPVKAAMAMLGMIEEVYRLPLCPLSDSLKDQLRTILRKGGFPA